MFNDAEATTETTGLGRLVKLKKMVEDISASLTGHAAKLSDLDKRIEAYEKSGHFETVKRKISVKGDFYGYIRNINKELKHEFKLIIDDYEKCNVSLKSFLAVVKEEFNNSKESNLVEEDGIISFNAFQDKKNIIIELDDLILKSEKVMQSVLTRQNEMVTKSEDVILKMRKNLNA